MRVADKGGRLPWIDMLRGACVMAVVLLHVNQYTFLPVDDPGADHSPVWHVWSLGNRALGVVRMPLLLLISGWLAASKLRAGLTRRTWASIATNLHLYVVWFCLYVVLDLLVVPGGPVVTAVSDPTTFLRLLFLHDSTPLWFVYGLAFLAFVVALLHRVPAPVMLVGFLGLGLVVDEVWGLYGPMWTRVLRLAVFFAVGVYGREVLARLGSSRVATPLCALGAVGVYAATGGMWADPPYLAVVAIGVLAFVALAGVVQVASRATWVRAPFAWAGRRTLGVYVLHWPLVCGVALVATRQAGSFRTALASPLVELAYPLVVTAVVVALCLVLETGLRRAGLGVLFRLPRSWEARVLGGESGGDSQRRPAGSTSEQRPGVSFAGRPGRRSRRRVENAARTLG